MQVIGGLFPQLAEFRFLSWPIFISSVGWICTITCRGGIFSAPTGYHINWVVPQVIASMG